MIMRITNTIVINIPRPVKTIPKWKYISMILATAKDVKARYEQGDIYIPRIKWTKDDNKLIVFWMNRHQDNLKLLPTDAKTGASNPVYEEKNKYFIEINDDWWFLKDRKNLLFTSEKDGYYHLYM